MRKIVVQRCNEPILYIKPVYRVTRIYYREKKYRKRCQTYLNQVIKERKELIAPINNNQVDSSTSQKDLEKGLKSADHKNLIDQLILHERQFSDEEIHDHIFTFITAGYETTSLQTAFTLLLLAMHQENQEKVYQEILKVFPNDDTTMMSREKLESLQYLEMVIQESMRLLPPVPFITRKTQEQFELNNLIVPKGVILVMNLYNLHRKKEIWGPDADIFKPERFLPEFESKRHSHSFLPFSQGTRDCLGKYYAMLAMRTILVKFLRNYKIMTDLKYEELKLQADLTLKICQNLNVKLVKR